MQTCEVCGGQRMDHEAVCGSCFLAAKQHVLNAAKEAKCSVCSWRGPVAELDIGCCPACHASVIRVSDPVSHPAHYCPHGFEFGKPPACEKCYAEAFDAEAGRQRQADSVNPLHYKGDYVMRITEDFGLSFCLGNVVKYVLRAKEKGGAEDLKKAAWYLNREIERAGK
jgi:Protein of unknwon function (DUF3310)